MKKRAKQRKLKRAQAHHASVTGEVRRLKTVLNQIDGLPIFERRQ